MQGFKQEVGKGYQIIDDKGPQDIIIRTKEGVLITNIYDRNLSNNKQIFGQSTHLLLEASGRIAVIGAEKSIMIYDLIHRKPIEEKYFKYIYHMSLSASHTFFQVLDKKDQNEGLTTIYRTLDGQKIGEFEEGPYTNYYSKTSYPLIRFTNDDKSYFRYNNKAIEIYNLKQELQRVIKTGPLQFFQLSKTSTHENYMVVCIYLEKKNNQGNIEIYTDKDEPIYKKNIIKAEEIKIRFSPTSNNFLMQLQTYYDPTGKSYYGQYGLFLFDPQINKILKVKAANGPIHDFAWDKAGQNFIVISGFMPAETVMFNKNNEKVFQLGKHHRNQIVWGHLGRFVCIAGYGNLSGEMEIWDIITKQKIGFCKSNSASYCQWSPDDRKIMTAIVTPRLRVDNCFKIFSYTGKQLSKTDFSHTELYEGRFLKDKGEYEARGLSPGRKCEVQKKEQPKFKSFGQSMNLGFIQKPQKKQQNKLIPGQHPEQPKKKRKRKDKNYEPKLQA